MSTEIHESHKFIILNQKSKKLDNKTFNPHSIFVAPLILHLPKKLHKFKINEWDYLKSI